MRRRVKIAASFPSIEKVAKRLGVSRTVVKRLSQLAERAHKTGRSIPSGVRKRRRNSEKRRSSRSATTRKRIKIPAKRAA